MTLREYLEELAVHSRLFATHWEQGHRENAEFFPNEMDPEEWDEQFRLFVLYVHSSGTDS